MKLFLSLMIYLALAGQAYAQSVITVGHFGADFRNPVDAVEAIGTTYPSATFHNRYVINVMPGVYRVNEPIRLKRYVSLVGAGRQATEIRGDIPGRFRDGFFLRNRSAVIQAASYSEISGMTVVNEHEDSSNYVISARLVNDIAMQNLIVLSTGKSHSTGNWKTGLSIEYSNNVELGKVSVRSHPLDGATCIMARVVDSTVHIDRSEFVSDGCDMAVAFTASQGSRVSINNSRLEPKNTPSQRLNSLFASGTDELPRTRVSVTNSTIVGRLSPGIGVDLFSPTVRISFSEFDGEVSGPNQPYCYRVHDGDMNPLDRSCN